MGKIIRMADHRPHVTITTHSGAVHTVPVATFAAIASGAISVDQLDCRDALLRVVIAEWLSAIGLEGAESLREMEDGDGPS